MVGPGGKHLRERFSIVWHASASEIPPTVWQACFPAPFEGQWWYAALERSAMEDQFTFSYASVRRGDELVGIVPTFVMDLPLSIVAPDALRPVVRLLGPLLPSVRSQRTLFVGSPCSEHGTMGFRDGVSLAEVLPEGREHGVERANRISAQARSGP